MIESSLDLPASHTAEGQTQAAKWMFKGWKAAVLFCQSVLIWDDQEGEISCFNISQWGGEEKQSIFLEVVLNVVNGVGQIVSS